MSPPLFLLGEAMGENEAEIGAGFVGNAGIELLRMLDEADLVSFTDADAEYLRRYYREGDPQLVNCIWNLHPEVHRSNVFQIHPPGNKLEFFCGEKKSSIPGFPKLEAGGWVREEFSTELDRLADEVLQVNPNLIIGLGNTALWALCGIGKGISKLRGCTRLTTHTVAGYKFLPTYHPSNIFQQWKNRPLVILDLMKAKREAGFPEVRRPERMIWIEPSVEDIERFYHEQILNCRELSVDIETSGTRITCIGFAPTPTVAIVIPFIDTRGKSKNYWPTASVEGRVWGLVARILGDGKIKKVFQNGLYDITFLLRSYGIKTRGAEEDTMLLHHALQPESLKGLGFLGSVYCDEGAWKQERGKVDTIKRDE